MNNNIIRMPVTLMPGVTVKFDAKEAAGPVVDLTAEQFAELYGPIPETATTAQRLVRALKRGAIAAAAHADEDDGGTCNCDAPALNFAACGMKMSDAQKAIESAGLRCYDWKPFRDFRDKSTGKMIRHPKYLVINGFQLGQANRRTSMSEAFHASMNADGFECGMYYRMD